MRKILVPTDFSDNAYHALRYAMHLFKNEPCTFYLLNAYAKETSILAVPLLKQTNTKLSQTVRQSVKHNLDQVREIAKKEGINPKHTFKTLPIADTLLNAIGKTVLDNSIQYIFMGTKGTTGLKTVFFGSNTVKVISKINFCPLIAVPMEFEIDTPKEIVFATGFEHVYDTYELNPMITLAKIWNAKIHVLHLIAGNGETKTEATARKVIEDRLKDIQHDILEVTKSNKISTEIEKITALNPAIGMVVIINYWHSFLEKLTHESVIKNITFNTKVPLLVLHLPD
ncbi:universal stress protein [Maribacter sp. CXY002]|uniref:universal stress protein n=1 Tax=Maribacter luteocoastalis TaxID=3407671 RepID=UPI003B684939